MVRKQIRGKINVQEARVNRCYVASDSNANAFDDNFRMRSSIIVILILESGSTPQGSG
jgi:hypothetical protein